MQSCRCEIPPVSSPHTPRSTGLCPSQDSNRQATSILCATAARDHRRQIRIKTFPRNSPASLPPASDGTEPSPVSQAHAGHLSHVTLSHWPHADCHQWSVAVLVRYTWLLSASFCQDDEASIAAHLVCPIATDYHPTWNSVCSSRPVFNEFFTLRAFFKLLIN